MMLSEMSLDSLETNSFICHFCLKVFTHAVGLNIHFRSHFSQNVYICDFCQKIFSKQCLLLEHLQSHEECELFKCDECHKIFLYPVALNVHRQSHTKTKKDLLSSAFATAVKDSVPDDEIEIPESIMTDTPEYYETYSDCISSENEESLEFNMLPDKSSTLNVLQNEALNVHHQSHIKTKKDLLSFAFATAVKDSVPDDEIEIPESIKTHTPEYYETYSDCISSENEESLEFNMLPDKSSKLNVLQNEEDSIECHFTEEIKRPLTFTVSQNKGTVCDFSQDSTDKNNLSIKKVYLCNVCNKEYFTQNGLDNHSCKFGEIEEFMCDICNATFSLKTVLHSHRNLHKRFRCKICMKEFSNSQKYLYHINSHEKPFKCIVCEKGFAAKMHLEDHLRMHIDDKPFECEDCLATFSQRSHLNRHLRMHEKRRLTFQRKSAF